MREAKKVGCMVRMQKLFQRGLYDETNFRNSPRAFGMFVW